MARKPNTRQEQKHIFQELKELEMRQPHGYGIVKRKKR